VVVGPSDQTPPLELAAKAPLELLPGEDPGTEGTPPAPFELSAELAASLASAAAAAAEAAELRERVQMLESWLGAAAEWKKVEYVQARRLALMKAVERDARYSILWALPMLLLVVYSAGLVALVWWLLLGH
jgi:hypothetical protein